MSSTNIRHPKTHSDILWHFTGGPKWNSKKNCQNKKIKNRKESFDIALKILQSKTLKLGSYHELIKVIVPEFIKWDKNFKSRKVFKNYLVNLPTSPVCCLADIPESELYHHSKRYGKMGIGFKRSSVIESGFNPVFYTLYATTIAKNFFSAQRVLNYIETNDIEFDIDNLIDEVESNICRKCEDNINLDNYISLAAGEIRSDAEKALNSLSDIMSFVKTFDNKEFDTIYAEREWRSVSNYSFTFKDVEKIVFPNAEFKSIFKKKYQNKLGLPSVVKLCLFDELGKDDYL